LDGLQLGAMLLALWELAAALGQLVSWVGHGFRDVSGIVPADDGSAAASGSVVAVLAAITFVALLRGRVRVALVAVVVWVLAGVPWAIIGYREGTVDGLAIGRPGMVVWLAVVGSLPLLAVLAVLVWRGGGRSRSWGWLLVPAALGIAFAWAPVLLAVVVMVSLVGLVAALALAVATGEVRPAVALAVVGLPWILGTVLGILSSPAAALAVAALAAWGALRARQRQGPGPGRTAGGPAEGAPTPERRLTGPQLTAFFTSAAILASSAAVNFISAKEVGHMAPSSRFATSLKPNVAYLELNFFAGWKKQRTLPSLAYAGIPYHSRGERAGALALMTAWIRSAIARSDSGISAIFASTSLSPSALSARAPRRADAFSSWARAFIAARSSSVHPSDVLSVAVVRLADFCVSFIAGFLPCES
jgi:hypothetical protein